MLTWKKPGTQASFHFCHIKSFDKQFFYLVSQTTTFMAEPLTDLAYLEANGDTMRVKMELMIMKVQKEFCKSLENEEDPKNKFMVEYCSLMVSLI